MILAPRGRSTAAYLAAVTALAAAATPLPAAARVEGQGAARPDAAPSVELVTLPSAGSPLVAVRLVVRTGSIEDPAGKEGLAALTALMIGSAGTARRSYAELADDLYPMAAGIEVETDREVTVLAGEIHRDKLAEYTALLTEALLEPGFAASDFERNREELLARLTTTLRAANDELLGLEAIQQAIFEGHPYGHAPEGTVQGLAAITLDDVKDFYRTRYTRDRLTLGVAGGYPEDYPAALAARLAALPAGEAVEPVALAPAPRLSGRRFTLVEKETASVGIHFGFPLAVTRADPDYYPLMLANSYLGEHRTFHGRLMQQLRGERGLNYGDYSYIEHWYLPPSTSSPSPGVPRRQQYFSVWVRPVVPETAHFALRAALSEVERLVERGLTAEEFELAREFLINYSKLWTQTLADRLGFALDSRFYGMGDYVGEIEERLSALTLEEVNRAVKQHLTTERYEAVLVTANAAAVKAWLESDEPSPMTYNTEPAPAVKEADRAIEKLPVKPTEVRIVPVAEMFER